MQLALWTYEGPTHVGAMRVAASLTDVHCVLHAPQGDTYADLLFTMIERRDTRPPVTWTTFQAQDLGGDTAQLLVRALHDAHDRFQPAALMVGASCTAELIQDDPGGLAARAGLPVPVVALDLPAYSKKENWGAGEALYQLVRRFARPATVRDRATCNILGPCSLGFRHRDDVAEVRRLLESMGVTVNVVAPLGASVADLARLGEAAFNVVLYPEIAGQAAAWMQRNLGQGFTRTVPIGVGATRDFCAEVAELAGVAAPPVSSRLPWYARSVDSTYLTGKRAFVFGDGTHALALARVATEEMGFDLVGLGTYTREMARDIRACAERHGIEALVTDDHLEVEAAIAAAAPEIVLGTQMERHVAKRLGLPCAVISAPVHVQDFPARTSPVMGWEGANVLFDTLVHPLMMGLEEHLIGMFREDGEFHADAAPSHLGHAAAAPPAPAIPTALSWADDAERELRKIPFFVRGKARRNTESYATERGIATITVETLYDAKAHFSR